MQSFSSVHIYGIAFDLCRISDNQNECIAENMESVDYKDAAVDSAIAEEGLRFCAGWIFHTCTTYLGRIEIEKGQYVDANSVKW